MLSFFFLFTPNYPFMLVFSNFEDVDFFLDHFNVELEEDDFLEDFNKFDTHLDEFLVDDIVSNRIIVKNFIKKSKKDKFDFPDLFIYFDKMIDLYAKDLDYLNDETLDYEVEDFLI
jgi:hypothetical protein